MDVSRRALASAGRLAPAFLLLGLGACSALGPQKMPQDEFAIQTNRPLVLPPSYDLTPPQPGKPQSGPPPSAEAQQALYGQTAPAATAAPAPTGGSVGESALLQRAGAAQANPDIRQQVNAETAPVSDRGAGMTDRVLGWQKPATGTGQQGTTQQGGTPAALPPNTAGDVGAGPPNDTTAPAGAESDGTNAGQIPGYTAPAEVQ